MKKIIGIFLSLVILSACSGAESDSAIAAQYGITVEQYREIKAAAEGMNMSVESHLQLMGYTPKQ